MLEFLNLKSEILIVEYVWLNFLYAHIWVIGIPNSKILDFWYVKFLVFDYVTSFAIYRADDSWNLKVISIC